MVTLRSGQVGREAVPKFEFSRPLPYAREQVFDLAADVEHYPEFLPGWRSAAIVAREGDVYMTEQVIGFGPVRQRFRTRTALQRPDSIRVTAIDGPFNVFQLDWSFAALAPGRSEIRLIGALELNGPVLRGLFGEALAGGFKDVLVAFEARAVAVYGPPISDI